MPEELEVVVTDRPGAETPVVRPLPWYAMIGIRVARLAIFTVLGNLGAGALTGTIGPVPLHDFGDALKLALNVSVGPIVVSLLWNGLEILQKWDQTKPELRA